MANTSALTLSNLVAYGTAVGGVDAASSGTSIASLQANTAMGATPPQAATSSVALKAVVGVAAGLPYNPSALQPIIGTGTAVEWQAGTSAQALQFITARSLGGANGSSQQLPLIEGQASSGIIGFSGVAQAYRSGAAVGLVGALGTSSATNELITGAAQGFVVAVGTSSLSLPLIQGAAKGYLGTGASFSAVVMHTESQALWTYTNFNFNSFARFNGKILAASDAGLYSLEGADDAGTKIDAYARMGITDFNTSHLKRVERVYVGYRSSGEMVLRVYTDEINQRDYLIPRSTFSGLHGNHVKLGRGLDARYWQFEVRNRNGSDFSLNMLECKPIQLKRRVGRDDA